MKRQKTQKTMKIHRNLMLDIPTCCKICILIYITKNDYFISNVKMVNFLIFYSILESYSFMPRKINYHRDRHCNFISRWIRQSISCSIHEQACLWHFDSGNPFNHFCNARHLEAIFCCWNKIMFHWLSNLNAVTWFLFSIS